MTTGTAQDTPSDQAEPLAPRGNRAVIAAIQGHHQKLADQVAMLTAAVLSAAADEGGDAERVALYGWYRNDLLPHARAEEAALYNRGSDLPATALLVRGMLDEHAALRSLVDELAGAGEPLLIATLAASAKALFDVHLAKENDLLLPALDEAGVDLAAALAGMHEILGHAHRHHDGAVTVPPGGDDGHVVAQQPAPGAQITGTEEVDVRVLPHQQRHTLIFAKLNALGPAGSVVIINDHDPLPLRYQADALWPGKFEWTYRESGPEVWRVAITLAR